MAAFEQNNYIRPNVATLKCPALRRWPMPVRLSDGGGDAPEHHQGGLLRLREASQPLR
jgi:hypothetical protein